jgi:hypothetical protein
MRVLSQASLRIGYADTRQEIAYSLDGLSLTEAFVVAKGLDELRSYAPHGI